MFNIVVFLLLFIFSSSLIIQLTFLPSITLIAALLIYKMIELFDMVKILCVRVESDTRGKVTLWSVWRNGGLGEASYWVLKRQFETAPFLSCMPLVPYDLWAMQPLVNESCCRFPVAILPQFSLAPTTKEIKPFYCYSICIDTATDSSRSLPMF